MCENQGSGDHNRNPLQLTSLTHDPPYFISAPVVGTNNSITFFLFVLHLLEVGAPLPYLHRPVTTCDHRVNTT